MSAQGVLAVMDGALAVFRSLGVTKSEAATEASMTEARATVAELIEANRRLIDSAPDAWWKGARGKHLSDIRDALARAGGEK